MSSASRNFDVHAFCALPLVRRVYQALVVALAVFLLTLVILHEPFRGYLAEVQITGPATEGLNLDQAVAWLKQADSKAAVIAVPAGEISPKSQIRATYVSRLPKPAEKRLDDLAQRWLYQYLPDRLQTYRRTVLTDLRAMVQQAREQEDAAQQRLELLRLRPLAEANPPMPEIAQAVSKPTAAVKPAIESPPIEHSKSHDRLEQLRLELSRLMVSCTDAHPQVVTLRSQIQALERELHLAPGEPPPQSKEPELAPAAANQFQSRSQRDEYPARRASHVVASRAGNPSPAAHPLAGVELAAQLEAAIREVTQASRQRQAAEHRLTDRMQELASQPTAAQWSAIPARTITRLGGTPRSSTVLLGLVLGCLAGTVLFRAAGVASHPQCIQTTAQLAGALELPVVGEIRSLRSAAWRFPIQWLAARSVTLSLFASEAAVAVAAGACVVAMLIEPSLARQVVADPFGTLSEVLERFSV